MADEPVVQQGAASEGAASGAAEAPAGEKPAVPTFTPEQQASIDQMLKAKIAEITPRIQQGATDKAMYLIKKHRGEAEQAKREAAEARNLLGVYGKHLNELDPETGTKLRLASYEERERFEATQKQAERAEREKVEFDEKFRKSYDDEIAEAGVDPKDVDWANDTDDYLERKSRINKSIIKAMKTREKGMQESLKKEVMAEVQAELLKHKKALGLDSVDSAGHMGGGKGRKPSLEELRRTPAGEVKKKFDSGEWSDK